MAFDLKPSLSRREFLKKAAGLSAGVMLAPFIPFSKEVFGQAGAHQQQWLRKAIPSTGKLIPVIGMGTWITFNVGDNEQLRQQRAAVVKSFFDYRGGMIDSSPMYGSSEEVLGYTLNSLRSTQGLFTASKIWHATESGGKRQFDQSCDLWDVETFDLFQVHNLLSWPQHLETLRRLKADNKISYVGVTTSHGRRHDELENIMRTQELDFVQLTYNALDRAVEDRLLPLAADRGIAVIANRPFQGGALIDRVQRHPFPKWGQEFDCANWPQLLLKFIVSHPAVTCAIPATSQVQHMEENMGAAFGRLPDLKARRRILQAVRDVV